MPSEAQTRVETKVVEPRKRRRKYIPGLAYFRFKPRKHWSKHEARILYEMTRHRFVDQDAIIFQDCVVGMEKMPRNSVDLVVADPPFGLDFSGKERLYNRDRDLVVDLYREIDDDNYGEVTEKWMSLLPRIMKPQATAYVFSGWTHLEEVLRGARRAGLTTMNHIIWKYQFGVFTKKKFVTSHYHILLLAKDPDRYFFNKIDHYPEDVWIINRKYRRGQIKNGTTLPEEVVRRCIEYSSKPGDLVFDPFMGMATTAVAAKGTWRHFLGFEINKELEPTITRRLIRKEPGQDYLSFKERKRSIIEEMSVKYPRAYEIFLEENMERKQIRNQKKKGYAETI